jgi:hypothetical protein
VGPAAAWRRAWEAAGDGEQYVWLEASGAREAAAALTAASPPVELAPRLGAVLFYDMLCAHNGSMNVRGVPRLAISQKW